jgi:hypothetical protein
MRGWQRFESILRKGTNVFFGLLAEGDNQRLLGEMVINLKSLSWLTPITSQSIIPIAATMPINHLLEFAGAKHPPRLIGLMGKLLCQASYLAISFQRVYPNSFEQHAPCSQLCNLHDRMPNSETTEVPESFWCFLIQLYSCYRNGRSMSAIQVCTLCLCQCCLG